jgi:hypothetical protein
VNSGVYLVHAVAFDSFDLSAQTVVTKVVVLTRNNE